MPAVSARPIRVLTVDYSPIVREGILRTLDDPDFTIVGMLDTSRDILATVRRLAPNVIMTELMSRDTSALDILRQIRGMKAPPAVLVLTRYENNTNVVETVRAGAKGFLLERRTTAPLLREALKTIADGATLIGTDGIDTSFTGFDGSTNGSEKGLITLTKAEGAALRLLALGYTNAEIAARSHVSVDTVKRHVSEVIRKLGARSRAHAALLGAHAGLVGLNDYTDNAVNLPPRTATPTLPSHIEL